MKLQKPWEHPRRASGTLGAPLPCLQKPWEHCRRASGALGASSLCLIHMRASQVWPSCCLQSCCIISGLYTGHNRCRAPLVEKRMKQLNNMLINFPCLFFYKSHPWWLRFLQHLAVETTSSSRPDLPSSVECFHYVGFTTIGIECWFSLECKPESRTLGSSFSSAPG